LHIRGLYMNESHEMNQQINQYKQQITSYTGKLLRDHFGKGPESVFVSIGHTFIIIYLRNFLTPSERVLLEQDHILIIDQMREKLMQMMIPEISGFIEIVTGVRPREFYYDWSLHNKTGMLVAICSEPIPNSQPVNERYTGKPEIEEEILKISRKTQKEPEELYSCEISPRMLLIIRTGILVRIEKELIRLGHGELLKGVKRNMEKSFLHNNDWPETPFSKRLSDTFVDWNFDLDKSVILLTTEPR